MTVRTVIGSRDGRMRSDLFPFKAISVMHKEKKTVLRLKPWQTERTVFFVLAVTYGQPVPSTAGEPCGALLRKA